MFSIARAAWADKPIARRTASEPDKARVTKSIFIAFSFIDRAGQSGASYRSCPLLWAQKTALSHRMGGPVTSIVVPVTYRVGSRALTPPTSQLNAFRTMPFQTTILEGGADWSAQNSKRLFSCDNSKRLQTGFRLF